MQKTPRKEKWVEIVLATPDELSDALANFVTEIGAQGVFQEELIADSFTDISSSTPHSELKAYLPWGPETKKQIASLKKYIRALGTLFPHLEKPTITTNTIIDPDWGEQWKRYYKPVRISDDIVIKPTWERYAPVGRDIVVDIDPGMAFGTGQHPSTRMCIVAMEKIITASRLAREWNVLDIGTGTGILAICCAKLGVRKVTAIDLDPLAIEIAGKNIGINSVGNRVEILNRDAAMCKGHYDLIIANLTANVLIKLRPHIIRMANPGAYMILSGIIAQDTSNIETIFQTSEVTIHDTLIEKEWICYVLKKRSAHH